MSSVIKGMENLKIQIRLLQEVQETSLSVHAAICTEQIREDEPPTILNTPLRTRASSTGTTPQPTSPRIPMRFPPRRSPVVETQRTPLQHRRIDVDGGSDEDLLLLAQLQGRLSPNPLSTHEQRNINRGRQGSSRDHGRRNDNNTNSNIHQKTRDRSPRSRDNERFRLRGIPRDSNSFKTALRTPTSMRTGTTNDDVRNDYNRNNRSSRHNTSVITGTSNNCRLSAAPSRANLQQRKDGLFLSRLSRDTRAIDVVNYIRIEANLNLRIDPLATKYDSYRSYFIHAHPRHHDLLLRPGMWSKNGILHSYQLIKDNNLLKENIFYIFYMVSLFPVPILRIIVTKLSSFSL